VGTRGKDRFVRTLVLENVHCAVIGVAVAEQPGHVVGAVTGEPVGSRTVADNTFGMFASDELVKHSRDSAKDIDLVRRDKAVKRQVAFGL
jgi:hypothetical protein